MAELLLQYSTSTAWESTVIRKLCHSPFSHVDVLIPGEGLLGASGPGQYPKFKDPGGVLIRPFDPWPYLHPPFVAHLSLSEEQVRSTIETWRGQIGKPFDDEALFEFLSDKPADRDWRDRSKWFCSEGVTWAQENAKNFFWRLVVPKSRVSPADSLLINNPLMTDATIEAYEAYLTMIGQSSKHERQ